MNLFHRGHQLRRVALVALFSAASLLAAGQGSAIFHTEPAS